MSIEDVRLDQRNNLVEFGMTDDEIDLWEKLADVAGRFLALPVLHPMEQQEAVHDLHNLQARLLGRPGLRAIGWPRPE